VTIGAGVLLPGVAENPTFPILRTVAYTTGLGYRPTCDDMICWEIHALISGKTVNTKLFKRSENETSTD